MVRGPVNVKVVGMLSGQIIAGSAKVRKAGDEQTKLIELTVQNTLDY